MVFLTIAVEGPLVGLHVSMTALLFATAATLLLGVFFGAVALAVVRRRVIAVGARCRRGDRGGHVPPRLAREPHRRTHAPSPSVAVSHWAAPANIVTGGTATGLVWLVMASVAFIAIAAIAFGRRDVR